MQVTTPMALPSALQQQQAMKQQARPSCVHLKTAELIRSFGFLGRLEWQQMRQLVALCYLRQWQ